MKRTLLLLLLTLTLTATLLPAEAQSTPVPCEDAPAPRLLALAPGRVTPGGAANNLRAEPSTAAEVVGQVPPGAVLNVLNRTACADGYRWYEVVYHGVVGWTVEGQGETYFLEPFSAEVTDVVTEAGVVESAWLRLDYDVSLASGVTAEWSPGYTLADSMSPRPRNVRFAFADFPGFYPELTCCQAQPGISLFPVSGFLEIDPARFSGQIDGLRALLDERAPLPNVAAGAQMVDRADDLPYLPEQNAVQVFALDPQYVDFENGAGIRYVTVYVQQLAEFDAYSLFYTFQGLTDDGATYVSAQFPLVLPADALPPYVEGDYEDMMSWYRPYFETLVSNLQALNNGDYRPDLTLLDALIASMSVGTVA